MGPPADVGRIPFHPDCGLPIRNTARLSLRHGRCRRTAYGVVGKDEFESRVASGGSMASRTIPEGVEHHEESVAPRPAVIVLPQADKGFDMRTAGEEAIELGIRIVEPSRRRVPNREVLGRAIQAAAGFASVIAQDEEKGE